MENKELLEKFKKQVAIQNFRDEDQISLLKQEKGGICMWKKKIIIGLCGSVMLISGVTLATHFDKIIETFGLGNGIDTAAQNGYIANPNMDPIPANTILTDKEKGISLENIKVNAKIEDFLMDDLTISTHFTFQIDPKINETIHLDDLHSVELEDLMVTDEENRILCCMDKGTLKAYCEEQQLNDFYTEYNENYYDCGLNTFITYHDPESGMIKITYNMYTGGESFPKSKKLNVHFSTMILKRNDWFENENSMVKLKGNWNIDLDVPEKMYQRQTIAYQVVKCENSDFQVTNATLTDTGFELGMIVSNMPSPEIPKQVKDLWKEYEEGKISINEYNRKINEDKEIREIYEDYRLQQSHPIAIYDYDTVQGKTNFDKITYVENEKGQKFESTMSPSRRQDSNFIDGDKYSFYETFGLTTKEATNTLKVRVLFKNKPYIIELKKGK